MPSWLLSDTPTVVGIYDVLAQSDKGSSLMLHALLSFDEGRPAVTKTTDVKCVHMGPPFGTHYYQCHAAGSAMLSNEERRKIKTFVGRRLKERDAERARLRRAGREREIRAEYCILPSAQQPTKAFPLWRFSCVGFALQAYRTARIELLASPLPLRSLEDLKRFYPYAAARLDDPQMRKLWGIDSGDRWPVALVGYVLHSLNREHSDIRAKPYTPELGDEHFPRAGR